MKNILFLLLILSIWTIGCQQPNETALNPLAQMVSQKEDPVFKDYWYQGKAEISVYELEQNRYQDIHPGETVLIFVTEDFLTKEQVKNDSYSNPNSTSVLKTNLINRFTTGIYDYSIMTSVFTPVDTEKFPHTLKTTTSAQDWCGQSWMQVNKEGNQYCLQLRSYFEKEGDQNVKAAVQLLEDEILNQIRINPAALPTGAITIFPSNQFLRLAHQPFAAVTATASLQDYSGQEFTGKGLKQYRIKMPTFQRDLTIVFEGVSPYRIEGWIDSYPSAFDGQIRSTKAKRKETIQTAYWEQNSLENQNKRTELQLSKD